MNQPADDFSELLNRARHGDKQAVERLIERYEPEIRVVARVRLGPALRPYLDSVDLVQSVHRSLMIGLRHNRFNISTPEQLVGLAITMIRRKVASRWRHLRRQQRLSLADDDSRNLPQVLISLTSSSLDPGDDANLRDEVERLFQHLSETERQLIDLRLDGNTTAEAARKLKQDPDVLRVQLSRLRKRLKKIGLFSEWL